MAKQRLLLVDADPGSLKLLGASLRNAGFTVSSASTPDGALELVETAAPDLIISDTRLGDRDGFELVQQLKSRAETAAVPFIFLSSDAAVEAKITGLELGVDDYLTKPIFLREIIARVRLVLARREREGLEGRSARTQFSGSLEDMGTVDLVQTIDISRKTGVLELRNSGLRGGIWFRDGSIVDAELGPLHGERAFYRMLLWTEGRFELHLRPVHRPAAIRVPTQGLLMEGMRRIDEWGRMLEQLPPLDHILDVDPSQLRDRLAEIPDEINAVLRALDGARSLRSVLDEVDADDLETLSTVAKLYFEGLVVDTGRREAPRRISGSFQAPGPLDHEAEEPVGGIDPDAMVGTVIPTPLPPAAVAEAVTVEGPGTPAPVPEPERSAVPVLLAEPAEPVVQAPEPLAAQPTEAPAEGRDLHGRDEPTRVAEGAAESISLPAQDGTSTARPSDRASEALEEGDTSSRTTASEGPSTAEPAESSAEDSGKERRMTRKVGKKRGQRRESLTPPEPSNVIQFPVTPGRAAIPAAMKSTLSGLGPNEPGPVVPGAGDVATAAATALQVEPAPSEPASSREDTGEVRTSGVQPLPPEPEPVKVTAPVVVGSPSPAAAPQPAPAAPAADVVSWAATASGAANVPAAASPAAPPAAAPTAESRPSMATVVVTPPLDPAPARPPPAATAAASPDRTSAPSAPVAAAVPASAPSSVPPAASKPTAAEPIRSEPARDARKGKDSKELRRSGDDWRKAGRSSSDVLGKSSPKLDASAQSASGRSSPRLERNSDPHEASFFTASGDQGHTLDDWSDLQPEGKGATSHPGKLVTMGIVGLAVIALGVFGYWKIFMDPGEASLEGRVDERAALAAAAKAVRARGARTATPRDAPAPTPPPAPPPAATGSPNPSAPSAVAPAEPGTAAQPEPGTAPAEPGTPTEPGPAAPVAPAAATAATPAPTTPAEPVAPAPAPAPAPTAAPAAPAPTAPPAAPAAAPAAETYEQALAAGDGAARRGRSRDAVAAYERAIALNPQGDAALSALAFVHLNRGRNREAIQLAERAVAANPRNAQGWIVLGAARDALGQRGPAREAYRSCVQQGQGRWVRECRMML